MPNKLKFVTLAESTRGILNLWISRLKLDVTLEDASAEWVKTNHVQIFNLISQYENKGTRKNHLSILCMILRDIAPKKIGDKYEKILDELRNEVNNEKDQGFSKNEIKNWIPFDEIIKRRDELKIISEQDPTSKAKHYNYLMLCMYTYQEPIRKEYADMQIIYKARDMKNDQNYLYISTNGYHIKINNDKVIKTHGPASFKLNDELTQIIKRSLKSFPREYLFDGENKAGLDVSLPMEKSRFGYCLTKLFAPKDVSVDVLRSAYITDFYNKHDDLKSREALAIRMRHSQEVAYTEYYKTKQAVDELHALRPENPEPLQEPKIIVEKKPFNLKKWSKDYKLLHPDIFKINQKKYYDSHKDELQRKKILVNIANGNTAKPSKKSIEKYNLKQDETGKWY
jgi:hypothetical protein